MEVELIEDDAPDLPRSAVREVRTHPHQVLRAVVVLACAAALVGVGYLAGTSSTPRAVIAAPSTPPSPPAAAPSSSIAISMLIETTTGLYVDIDEAVLGSPVTAEATTLREAAELWAADQTAALTEPERALLREGTDGLNVTLDRDTGRLLAVTEGRPAEPVESPDDARTDLPPWGP